MRRWRAFGVADVLDIPTPPGGWLHPWGGVAEISDALPVEAWVLIGGLMVQAHGYAIGLTDVRPTADVDVCVRVEDDGGRLAVVADALEALGYALRPGVDPRSRVAHRFTREREGDSRDVVDVVIADHARPRPGARLRLRRFDPVRVDGGTQALRRTVLASMQIGDRPSVLALPDVLGALVMKAAAHQADTRDRERHLADAALLLACVHDPYAERARFAGSDRRRLLALQQALPDDHPAWLRLPAGWRRDAQATLRLLLSR